MADRERGTLRGPPLSLFSTTDPHWRRSSHRLGDAGATLAPMVGNQMSTRRPTMPCRPRWGSNPNGLPFRSGSPDRGGARRRHERDGSESHHEARHDQTTAEQSVAGVKTPAHRAHDSCLEVHDAGTGLPALAHAGASVRAMRAAKHQPRGFMVEPTGVHDERKASVHRVADADEPKRSASVEPLPISFGAKNPSRTDCRRTAARVSSSPASEQMRNCWTLTLTHLVGKAYGLPTAPESRWHRQRRFPLSTARLCHHGVVSVGEKRGIAASPSGSLHICPSLEP